MILYRGRHIEVGGRRSTGGKIQVHGLGGGYEVIGTVHAGCALPDVGELEIGAWAVLRLLLGLLHWVVEEGWVVILVLCLLLNIDADLLEGFVGGEVWSLLGILE